MDRILIYDLQTSCIIGIKDDERCEKQKVLINLALSCDLRKSGMTDEISDTVDYRALKKRILAMVGSSEFFLIEALADAIARICLEDPKIAAVSVQVEKPAALRFARSVGVRIVRRRKDGK
jgi:D-erythro-7,8-dihydroneopterin triphosphate epimerase